MPTARPPHSPRHQLRSRAGSLARSRSRSGTKGLLAVTLALGLVLAATGCTDASAPDDRSAVPADEPTGPDDTAPAAPSADDGRTVDEPADIDREDDGAPPDPPRLSDDDDPAPTPDDGESPAPDTRDRHGAETLPVPRRGHGLERAVWVHLFDGSLKTRASIERLVAELVQAEATAVIAQVARRHDAYYHSTVLPPTADPDLEPGLDVIAELTRRAHAAGIEVHAWISIAPTWHAVYEPLPAPAGWLPAAHGQTAPEADRWVSRQADGTWSDYLDPALPEVRAHVRAVVHELATTTAVDGIHLDYARYASAQSGYHPAALARFRAETGVTGTPAPGDPAWSDWRREQTRALVAEARAAIDAAGRDLTLSAAVIAWGAGPGELGGFGATRTAREVFQDWPAWARAGLVDAVLPMVYFRTHVPEQAAWLTDWLAFLRALAGEVDTQVVPGIGGWLNRPGAVQAQLAAAHRAGDGVALYSYQQPTDRPEDVAGGDGVRPIIAELAGSGWGGGPDPS